MLKEGELTFFFQNDIILILLMLKRISVTMNKQVANVQLMQKMNRIKVLNVVRRNPDISRPIIAEQTGLSLASITNITAYLLERGLLNECGRETVSRVGRKSTLLRFGKDAYNLIMVVLGEDKIYVALTDLEGGIKTKMESSSDKLSPIEVMETVRAQVKTLVESYGRDTILAIEVAISGIVLENSRFIVSAQLKWKSFDIKKMIEEETGISVFVNNISFLRAVSYFCVNNSFEKGNMLLVDMESGIGAVQFFEGEISRGTLGEIGHTTVCKDGEPCFCGNRGCLEAMCSKKRMLSIYEAYEGKKLSSLNEMEALVNENDETAVCAVEECGKYLGIGLANLVILFNPSVIVINTGDFSQFPSLLVEAEKELHRRVNAALIENLVIKKVSQTDEDTIRAGAFDLCNRIFDVSYEGNLV